MFCDYCKNITQDGDLFKIPKIQGKICKKCIYDMYKNNKIPQNTNFCTGCSKYKFLGSFSFYSSGSEKSLCDDCRKHRKKGLYTK